ncbi:hypothetical protein [Flavobacterium lindanitolerans]|jgi:hypothetical protein|uniref:Uncharacterized protein n=1 Tax=Flavobacterium lindanitolerans TaxID=428988 RepID=A0A497UIM7_9FLAO|nr:hypothetical protein [Flavobacterium lindanitolerans]MBC8644977.1 hypothetical protein [Flavobacterium lindanitolerans]PKW30153.1 hypothetical protein B0G92_1802 [Flavobacterium lindanitolerans]RLJ24493.1 hypothetical protein CLV50_2374 [Flavobacterium lindanitolerans]
MSLFLKNYGIKEETTNFKVTFKIPDNCEYSTFVDPYETNVINIQLKPYEKDPSSNFVEYVEYFSTINDFITVDFEIPDLEAKNSGPVPKWRRKPRLRIDDIKY